MSNDHEFSYHLIEEREFRERFLPAVQGNEPIVREILDACDASGPSWTALHKLFDETRVTWQRAVESDDGEQAQRSLFAAFARVVAHLRPAFVVRGFGLASLDAVAPELGRHVQSPGVLLRDPEGQVLAGVSAALPDRVPARCLPGRSGGGYIPRDEVRPCLDAFRAALPRLVDTLGPAAEPGLTVLLSALVEAKLHESALLEASDALAGDTHLPRDHKLAFERPGDLPPAVRREVARAYGRDEPPPPQEEPPPPPKAEPQVVAYTPRGTYNVGQRLQHKAFGTGEVVQVLDSRRLKVRFSDDEKTLVQGLPAADGAQRPDGRQGE
ncbi:MAG: hypothetical protein M9894_32525 [Planctomycetes bacterium]|nr:hypothetical protein [Planctomycetota bacterium]